jgi:hypothetical protein
MKLLPEPHWLSGGESTFNIPSFIAGPVAVDARCSCESNVAQKRARPCSPNRLCTESIEMDRSPSVSPPAPDKRNTRCESPSPPPSHANALQAAQALFKRISSTSFLEHQSIMQKLASAEQCHEYAAQLLAQAEQLHGSTASKSRFIEHISESCALLQLKMDSFPGHGT